MSFASPVPITSGIFYKLAHLFNAKEFPMATRHEDHLSQRHEAVVAAAKAAGLLSGTNSAVGARVPRELIDRAKMRGGIA